MYVDDVMVEIEETGLNKKDDFNVEDIHILKYHISAK